MKVIPARLEDIPRLCELLDTLFSQEAEFSPNRENQVRGLRLIMADPAIGTILVLKDGEGIVGMVNLLYTVSTFLGAKVAMVEDVIIAPSHRKQGAGTVLLQGAVDHALRQGCQRLTVLTDRANAPAHALYRKLGFAPSEMIPFRRLLSDESKKV